VNRSFFLLLVSFLFCLSIKIVAQNYNCSVEGRVISKSADQPLENVNVYISNTVWGTTTNKYGYFKIESLPFGNLKVVASMVGYKPLVASVTLKEGETIEVNFNLEETSYELNQILVTGKIPKDWKENFEEFKNYFLGEGSNTNECKILNPEVINFTSTKSGGLTANASQPIMIINYALGYKIRCDLDNFEWNKENQTLKYIIETYFTELKDSTGNLKKEWTKNREATYYGSMTDFIKSLINNTYRKDGFKVYHNKQAFKYKPLYKTYYQLDKPVIKKINNNYAELSFSEYLRIEYYSDTYHKSEISGIKLNFSKVLLDKFGYPVIPLSFAVYGDWAYSGVSNLLPKYYNPEEGK
jgi:predicted DNA-binding antitoxin AbrB/MazE fold protein